MATAPSVPRRKNFVKMKINNEGTGIFCQNFRGVYCQQLKTKIIKLPLDLIFFFFTIELTELKIILLIFKNFGKIENSLKKTEIGI